MEKIYSKHPSDLSVKNHYYRQHKLKILKCITLSNDLRRRYVVPIYKANDTVDPNNYRGITATAAIGKLFNSVLNYRLDAFLRNNELIHES